MICLVLGLVAGALATVSPTMAAVRPTWIHLITVGWLTQLIFGVALWMFPRPTVETIHAEKLGRAGFWGLNAGLLLRMIGEPLQVFSKQGKVWLIFSALLQLGAVLCLLLTLWPRVRRR
jgi:NnrS protein